MPCQPTCFTQLKVTKDVLIDEWHVLKIDKHTFNYEFSHINYVNLT
jgi:hypothetical protein